jgi:hypothetical protein
MELLQVPEEFQQRRESWFKLHQRLRSLHNSLGLFGIVSSVISVAGAGRLDEIWLTLAGVTSLLCLTLLVFYVPLDRAKVYIRAWRTLDEACLRYGVERGDERTTLADVAEAVSRGETIGHVD